ncbi:hypothetical protein GYMLUDRAFT_247888 [Collybiopsis luxurians FD-317 M1]|uniref:Alpha-type protein kinase domain-containing protein n=1 Tax=Collybiopsis luxurians FD-317 M1 TaxID=944289 RepID=A0A0D0B037_9AGAR|nr:hypothetical protein GYMLUDRAFT_247888 [Collybiopsis luxurians FD-317 M1]
MSTSKIQQIKDREQGLRGSEYWYTIHWAIEFTQKPAKFSVNLGSFATPFKGNIYMEEIKKELLEQANKKWNQNEVHDYLVAAPENLDQIDFSTHSLSKVQFERIDIELDAQYQMTLRLDNDAEMLSGRLDDRPFAYGGMKVVYNLQIQQEEFVAKRYFKLTDNDSDSNSIDEEKVKQNYRLISLDAGRLAQCKTSLHASNNTDIIISKHFLLREVGSMPSRASGIKLPDDSLGPDEGITWLVEPKRPSTFFKFTGTLSHARTHIGGLTSETVHAFAHFVYEFTNRQLVVADLQGTQISADGKNMLVLFDPMTHTVNGQVLSGSGDHGTEGIVTFERDHKCGPVCEAMGLAAGQEDEEEMESSVPPPDSYPKPKHGGQGYDPVHNLNE